jgi:hypothetical protein
VDLIKLLWMDVNICIHIHSAFVYWSKQVVGANSINIVCISYLGGQPVCSSSPASSATGSGQTEVVSGPAGTSTGWTVVSKQIQLSCSD